MMFYLQIIEQYSTNVNVQRRMAAPVRGRGQSYTCQMRAVSSVSCQAGCGVSFAWPGSDGPLSQEVGRCRGALKFCSFLHPLDQSLDQLVDVCRSGLGDKTVGAVTLDLGIADSDLDILQGELARTYPL